MMNIDDYCPWSRPLTPLFDLLDILEELAPRYYLSKLHMVLPRIRRSNGARYPVLRSDIFMVFAWTMC